MRRKLELTTDKVFSWGHIGTEERGGEGFHWLSCWILPYSGSEQPRAIADSPGILHSIQETIGHNYIHNYTPNAIFFNSADICTDDLKVMVGKTVGPLMQIKAAAPHGASSHRVVFVATHSQQGSRKKPEEHLVIKQYKRKECLPRLQP